MYPLQGQTEKQVFEFTVLTFNRLLGYIQERGELTRADYEYLGSKLLRLYQVWDVVWKRGGLQKLDKWKASLHWVQSSGALKFLKPLLFAEKGTVGPKLLEILHSPTFISWLGGQIGGQFRASA